MSNLAKKVPRFRLTIRAVNNQILENLDAAKMDPSGRALCMPDTRVKLLQDTADWLAQPPEATG